MVGYAKQVFKWLSEVSVLSRSSVVFSFWKKTLDIVGSALEAWGIKYLRVDGDIPVKKRNTTLLDFQNRTASRVLLMTFSTGAVGYVLTRWRATLGTRVKAKYIVCLPRFLD